MAHLTCVGWTYEDATSVIREFLDAGLTSFLAVRGDPPRGTPRGRRTSSATSRAPASWCSSSIGCRPSARRTRSWRFPASPARSASRAASRSRSPSRRSRTAIRARARCSRTSTPFSPRRRPARTSRITQLFFHAEDYLHFVDLARDAGVTMRILPGIMPVVSPARLAAHDRADGRADAGGSSCATHRRRDSRAPVRRRNRARHAHSASELLAGGAPGLHLYTYNKHEAVIDVLDAVGIKSPHHRRQRTTPTKEHA